MVKQDQLQGLYSDGICETGGIDETREMRHDEGGGEGGTRNDEKRRGVLCGCDRQQ